MILKDINIITQKPPGSHLREAYYGVSWGIEDGTHCRVCLWWFLAGISGKFLDSSQELRSLGWEGWRENISYYRLTYWGWLGGLSEVGLCYMKSFKSWHPSTFLPASSLPRVLTTHPTWKLGWCREEGGHLGLQAWDVLLLLSWTNQFRWADVL